MKSNSRLKPSLFSPRYVHLSKLRDETLKTIKALTLSNKNLTLIDFGCGDMPYRSVIEPLVGKYMGVDLDLNPQAEHHIGFDSKTTLPDNLADIILSNQVLEHVDSPEGYLQESFRLLKPGGTAIFTTHGYWFYHPTPNDYWRWTSAGLQKIVEREGFQISSFFGIMGLAASGIQLFQDAIINKLPKFMIPPIALIMQALIALFDKIHSQAQRNRDASLYIVIATKPLSTI
ncbi:MAG: class I SAM-dependent methyltransferase [Pyrinomonadaceae bacterium]|nr:class I SAM-dependent methyltransferase [Sphingobacteriaceae bacterium]